MKKLFLLSILLSTSLFQAVAGEWTDPATGIKWTFSNNGYGVGTGFTYVWTITAVENYGDNLVIPGTVYDGGAAITVEAIANNLFKDNITLTTISLPTSLKYIGNSAFSGCTALMTVNGNAVDAAAEVVGSGENWGLLKDEEQLFYVILDDQTLAGIDTITSITFDLTLLDAATEEAIGTVPVEVTLNLAL